MSGPYLPHDDPIRLAFLRCVNKLRDTGVRSAPKPGRKRGRPPLPPIYPAALSESLEDIGEWIAATEGVESVSVRRRINAGLGWLLATSLEVKGLSAAQKADLEEMLKGAARTLCNKAARYSRTQTE